jgi:hypothetical protein
MPMTDSPKITQEMIDLYDEYTTSRSTGAPTSAR